MSGRPRPSRRAGREPSGDSAFQRHCLGLIDPAQQGRARMILAWLDRPELARVTATRPAGPVLFEVYREPLRACWETLARALPAWSMQANLLRHAWMAFGRGDLPQCAADLGTLRTENGLSHRSARQRASVDLLEGALSLAMGAFDRAVGHLGSVFPTSGHEDVPADWCTVAGHLRAVSLLRRGDPQEAADVLVVLLARVEHDAWSESHAHWRIDLARAWARIGSPRLAGLLDRIGADLREAARLADRGATRTRLGRRLAVFAESGHPALLTFFGEVAMQGLQWPSYVPAAPSKPAPTDDSGWQHVATALAAMIHTIDRLSDLSGLSGALFPSEDVQALGLSDDLPRELGVAEHMPRDAGQWIDIIGFAFAHIDDQPGLVEALIAAGSAVTLLIRAMGAPDMAYLWSLCLQRLVLARGSDPEAMSGVILQRGFLLLSDGERQLARPCFESVIAATLAEGRTWSIDRAHAILGLGLCLDAAGRTDEAVSMLWSAYLLSRVVGDTPAATWRCAFAVSNRLGRRQGSASPVARQAMLLLDSYALEQFLTAFDDRRSGWRNPLADRFPALRQALHTLVSMERIAEAERLRDLARELGAARFVRGERAAASTGRVLGTAEIRAWEAAGLDALDRALHALREDLTAAGRVEAWGLPSGAGSTAIAIERRREAGRVERLRRLVVAYPAALARAASALAAGSSALTAPGGRTEPAVPPAPGVARLGYLVQPDRLILVLEHGERRIERSVAVEQAELRLQVFRFRALCADGTSNIARVREEGARLYRHLLAPVRDVLDQVRASELQVIPHGFLDLLPFGALWDGQAFLVERLSWSFGRRRPWHADTNRADRPPVVELLGSSEFADAPGLGGVREELQRIAVVTDTPRERVAIDRELTAERLLRALSDPGVDVVHLATHAVFDPRDPERSALLMGDGARVSLDTLLAGRTWPLRLLVLSACSTGVRAPDLDGFAGAFLQAGVRSVVAAQWPVDDQAAAWLMPAFHQALAACGGRVAEALRQAQRDHLRRHPAATVVSSGPAADPTHPRWWAPFAVFT